MYAMKWYTDFAEMQYGRLAPFFFGGGGSWISSIHTIKPNVSNVTDTVYGCTLVINK